MNSFVSCLSRFKIHHILFWLVYYVGWVQVYRGFYENFGDLLLVTLIYALAHASLFYLTQYLFIPRLLKRDKVYMFVLAFVVLMLVITVGMYGAISWIIGPITAFGVDMWPFMGTLALSNIFMTAVLISVKGFLDYLRNVRYQEQKEKQRLESELQYLKSQVNPHFLFNTINSVYVLIKQDPEKASDTLIKLSDLLRTQLYDFGAEKIRIEQEIEYLENYIELERLRKGKKLLFEMKKDNDLNGFYIAPLMLLPFLENCFKHVSSGEAEDRKIRISLKRNQIRFFAEFFNTKDSSGAFKSLAPGGIGLKNIRRRLELLYSGAYTLDINDQPDSFTVNLSLKIDERKN